MNKYLLSLLSPRKSWPRILKFCIGSLVTKLLRFRMPTNFGHPPHYAIFDHTKGSETLLTLHTFLKFCIQVQLKPKISFEVKTEKNWGPPSAYLNGGTSDSVKRDKENEDHHWHTEKN